MSFPSSLIRDGLTELWSGLYKWRIWHLIGSGDLRRRYSRSRIGQFWITLSTAISITIMSFIWSVLFKTNIAQMLPYMAISIILWQFFASTVSDATTLFVTNGHLMLSQRIECSVIVYASVYRNILTLFHNIIIIPMIFIIFMIPFKLEVMLMVPALILISITAVWVSYVIAILCARFRDLTNITSSVMQLAFYATPVIWKPDFIGERHQWILWINPFSYFLGILRSPILGESASYYEWIVSALIAFGGLILSSGLIGRYRRRLLYWI